MARLTTKTRWLWAAVALVAIVLLFVGWRIVRRSYSSEFMDVTWSATPGASPAVVGRIVSWNGRPEAGQQVQVNGGGATAVTNEDGRFELPAGGAVSELTVVGIDAIPLTRWNRPSGDRLMFDIHLKRPAPPLRGIL